MNKIKALLIGAVIALAFGPRPAFALSFGDLYEDFQENAKSTVLESVTPAHFYDLIQGRSLAGATTQIGTYRFLSADIGWASQYEGQTSEGTIILGGAIHVDRMIAESFPNFTAGSHAMIPKSMRAAWEKLRIGFYLGADSSKKYDFTAGIFSGLEFKF